MNIDLANLCEWQFSFSCGGRVFTVREPTMADAARMRPADDAAGVDGFTSALDQLITGDIKPLWAALTASDLIALSAAFQAYCQEHIQKKREAARTAARGQAASMAGKPN